MKSKLFLLLVVAGAGVSFIACKKSTAAASPSTVTGYYGFVQCQKTLFIQGSSSSGGATANAEFSSLPVADGGYVAYSSIDAGRVSVNGMDFTKQQFYNDVSYYLSQGPGDGPLNISVSGGGSVPAMDVSFPRGYPRYTGTALLPDTLYRHKAATIQVQGLSYADELLFMAGVDTVNTLVKTLPGLSTSISLDSTYLNTLPPGNGYINLVFAQNIYRYASGRFYKFQSSFSINKTVVIK